MTTAITTAPVAAQVYDWLSGDTITANLTTDEGDPYDLDNVKDQVLMFRGRTGDATDPSGFKFELTATISLCAMEMANTGALASENIEWGVDNALTYAASDQIATGEWPQLPSEIFTGYTDLHRDTATIRSNILLGYDSFTTGPSPASPPAVATVTCGSGLIHFHGTSSARTTLGFWETGYLALGINGRTLPRLDPSSIQISTVRLNDGFGYRYTLSWPSMDLEDVVYLNALWSRSALGAFPSFLFPVPGAKSTSGVISGTQLTPSARGGLVRLLDWSYTSHNWLYASEGWKATDCRLVAETWQEVAA